MHTDASLMLGRLKVCDIARVIDLARVFLLRAGAHAIYSAHARHANALFFMMRGRSGGAQVTYATRRLIARSYALQENSCPRTSRLIFARFARATAAHNDDTRFTATSISHAR